MFRLIEWHKDFFGKEIGISRGNYKSIEDAELEIPKGFEYSENPKLIETLPLWTILEWKYDGSSRFYVQQKKED